ncbi:hypothetical protein PsYK624_141100 [Phanerochaete sordida]|uniref:F-box domain-containing protein n=1 Tax=Phanerochaete sordida TaxID=48140 RepID=A0A9P3LJX8_9APHY|nr:hypothetical protein PsYK624_141100 [Phanerochaete sordida]
MYLYIPNAESALVNIALTSRVFYEPAMDELWANMSGFGRLIACLPDYAIERMHGSSFCAIITRTPLTNEWVRFAHHARRVRSMVPYAGMSHDPDDAFTPAALASLNIICAHAPKPVLPRLQYLEIGGWRVPCHLDAFLCPLVESLHLHNLSADDIRQVLPLVPTNVPQLMSLRVALPEGHAAEDDALRAAFSETVCAMEGLNWLGGAHHFFSDAALEHLSRLQSLETLYLSMAPTTHVQGLGAFRSLSTLSLAFAPSSSTAYWASFLRALEQAPLRVLSLSIPTLQTPASALIPVINTLGALNALQDLTIAVDISDIADPWGGTWLDAPTLAPLFALRGLTDVGLYNFPLVLSTPFSEPGSETYALLELAARAWPRLQSLSLETALGMPRTARARLEELAHLARCSALQRVQVELADVSAAWTGSDPAFEGAYEVSAVWTLDLREVRIDAGAVPAVVEFLSQWFPRARIEHAWDEEVWNMDDQDELIAEARGWQVAAQRVAQEVEMRRLRSL